MALPGVRTAIQDRFYSLSRTDIPVGPRVLILGTRDTADGTLDEDGNAVQSLDPYNAQGEETVITAFGEGSQVHRGYIEALSGGAQAVVIVALPADTVFNHTDGEISSVEFTTNDPTGDLFDSAFAAVESAQADVVVPWGRGIHSYEYEDPATPGNDPDLGFHADNSAVGSKSWAAKIANKMEEIVTNSHPSFAVLGLAPYGANPSEGATPTGGSTFEGMTPAQISSHTTFPNLLARESASFGNNGIYVTVVGGEVKPLGYPAEWGYSNGAAMLAGAVAQLDSWSAPTGKVIYNTEQIRYLPTKTSQEAMIDQGIIPVGINFKRKPIWVDGNTYGKPTSDYTRLTTLRIVYDAIELTREVAQRFIGETATLQNKNALETAITAGLAGMQQVGALLSSDFSITYVPRESRAVIDLILQPAFELRVIEVKVSVNI